METKKQRGECTRQQQQKVYSSGDENEIDPCPLFGHHLPSAIVHRPFCIAHVHVVGTGGKCNGQPICAKQSLERQEDITAGGEKVKVERWMVKWRTSTTPTCRKEKPRESGRTVQFDSYILLVLFQFCQFHQFSISSSSSHLAPPPFPMDASLWTPLPLELPGMHAGSHPTYQGT
jgi:hypothetical protein